MRSPTSIAALALAASALAVAEQEKAASPAPAQPQVAQPQVAQPPIVPLGEDRYRIGALTLDRRLSEIRVPGAIALTQGTLEYLVCAPGGKLYESLLRADVDPYHLQLALLLLGLEPTNRLTYQGDPNPPQGDGVTIEVEWEVEGARTLRRAEQLVWDVAASKPMKETAWVFTGSYLDRGVFAASVTKSLAAVYNDPAAILNIPLPTGAYDQAYVTRTDVLPPVDTPVEIVLRAAPAAGGEP